MQQRMALGESARLPRWGKCQPAMAARGFWMLFMRLLVADAVHKGAKHIIMGLGGSATSDAGIGMLRALIDAFAKHGGIPERCSPTRSLWDDIKEW